MNYLNKLQHEAQIAIVINAAVSLAVLVLMIWGVVVVIQMLGRWERREDAKVKALQRIAAKLPNGISHDLNSRL